MEDLVAIGRFQLDFRTRLLRCDGKLVALGPKVVETLAVLVSRRGEVVTKAEMMDTLWPERAVEEGNLTQNIYRLRRVLSGGGVQNAIETFPSRGYRFVADVRSVNDVRASIVPRPTASGPLRLVFAFASVIALFAVPPEPVTCRGLSAESLQAFRLGLYHLNLRSDLHHARLGLHYFQEIVSRDPENAAGYAGLADAYLAIFDGECDGSVSRCPSLARIALQSAQLAVRLDPASSQAHTALAMTVNEFRSDDRTAEKEFRTAIALDQSYPLAHHWYGNLLTVEGRYAEATREHLMAASLDPTSPATYAWLAKDAFFAHRYGDAISYARQAESLAPLRHPTIVLLGLSYERLGRLADARACFVRLAPLEARAFTAALLAREGQRDRAARMLRDIDLARALAEGASEAAGFAWIALGNSARARAYIQETPLPNRLERNFLARDPRWSWDQTNKRARNWVTPA